MRDNMIERDVNMLRPRRRVFELAFRYLLLPGTILFGAATIASATIDTSWISPNQPISASNLKTALSQTESRLSNVEKARPTLTRNGKSISLDAAYCGKTAPTTGQVTGGYAGVKSLCENVASCGSSKTAHLCSGEELTRSAQLGISLEGGFYASGNYAQFVTGGSAFPIRDCVAWTTAGANDYAVTFDPNGPSGVATCAMSLPMLCCD
jgi:hypothetical protein